MKDAVLPAADLREQFLRNAEGAFVRLVEFLPNVVVWAKDDEGRFVYGNRAMLRLIGLQKESDLIGKKDPDFFPADLCEVYARDDRTVWGRGEPLVDKVELIRNRDRSIDWYSTTKIPVPDRRGKIVAVLGVSRNISRLSLATDRFLALAPAVEMMVSQFADPLRIADLAAKVGLSVSQFERQFKKKFGVTPRTYLVQTRVEAACQLLITTDLRVAEVAQQTGFCDQSHFTHVFVKHRHETPLGYRARFGSSR